MGSKKLPTALLALLIVFQAAAQTKLIEKVVRKGNEVVIPYEKYQLSNGLTVIVHEDHSDPAVFVQVAYHVGSDREQEGRSGFAHFFEHMMFQGSEHVGDDQHFKILTAAGASWIDGQTNKDQTRYFQIVPSNQLETVFWLESDRMGYLLDSVTQAKFEIQRATVKNERGQNFDNRPYGLMLEKVWQGLYPEGHPYSWPIIGYIEDLNRVDVSDLKIFFLRWYTPNNATLTISGDVKTADVIKLSEKYFGPIPKGPEAKNLVVAPVVLTADRYISYEDKVAAPELAVYFPTVPIRHEDEAPLDILASILGGTKSSIFTKNFLNSGVAQFVEVSHPTYELSGEFAFIIRGFQDTKLSVLDSLRRYTLTEFEKRGITDEDLNIFKANNESQIIENLSGIKKKGEVLSDNQVFAGDPNYIVKDLKRYNAVTKEDVIRVYKKYIKDKNAVILSIYPKGKPELIAKADNFKIPFYNVNAPERDEYKNLVYNKPPNTFDRSKQPPVPAVPVVKVPDFWTQNFDNGLKMIGSLSDEIPMTTIQLYVEAGHRYESKKQAGIAKLLIAMMNESTQKYTSEQISDKLNLLGSKINIEDDGQDIIITITSLTKNIDSTLVIANEILFHPKFDDQEFERVKQQQLAAVENSYTQAREIADNIFSTLLYGNNHIKSLPVLGTKGTVGALTTNDLKNYYATAFSPSVSSIVVIGDISKEELIPKLRIFKNWKGNKIIHEQESALPVIDNTKIYFVNKPQAPQSEIRVGYLALPYDVTGDFYKAIVMNYGFGGTLTSRLSMNLREQHGYTYQAYARFWGNKFVGPFRAYSGVRTNATDDAVVQFMKEIKNYADNGITGEELKETKTAIGQMEALLYETPVQKIIFMKRIMDYGLDKSYPAKQSELLKSLTVADINAIAKKYLPYNTMDIVVVGDKAQVFEKLKGLGYEVVELDVNGELLKN
jgi:zinc protease